MTVTLERSIREYVAEGSGLKTDDVIPGNSKGPRPLIPYASVLLMHDQRVNRPIKRQIIVQEQGRPDRGDTAQLVWRRATYSVQFYRSGASDLAVRFDNWSMSENGLTWAQTAFATGQVNRIRVYNGGSGYDDENPPTVRIEGGFGTGATAAATVSRGSVTGVRMLDHGSGYVSQPVVSFIPSGSEADPSVIEPAEATARGLGFSVELPLTIRRIDAMIADEYEERLSIDVPVVYASVLQDNTGLIDQVDCEVALDGEVDVGRIRIGGATQ